MISMKDAALELELLCDEIENIEDLTPSIQQLFQDKELILSETVDKRIRFMEYAKAQTAQAKLISDKWKQRERALDKLLQKLKEDTLVMVKSSTVPLAGTLGKLRAVRNSIPTLIVNEDHPMIKEFYSRIKTEVTIDKVKLKLDLEEGALVEGAILQYGEHLRY